MAWISCSLSFSLLRSSIQCIRGARSAAGRASKQLIPPIDLVSTEAKKNIFLFLFFTILLQNPLLSCSLCAGCTGLLCGAHIYCNYYYKNNAFMAVRFAFVSADTNAIPADTNAIRRMLGYPHQRNRWLLLLWLLLVGGFRSLCMHAWPPG